MLACMLLLLQSSEKSCAAIPFRLLKTQTQTNTATTDGPHGLMRNLVCCDAAFRCSPYQPNNVPVRYTPFPSFPFGCSSFFPSKYYPPFFAFFFIRTGRVPLRPSMPHTGERRPGFPLPRPADDRRQGLPSVRRGDPEEQLGTFAFVCAVCACTCVT